MKINFVPSVVFTQKMDAVSDFYVKNAHKSFVITQKTTEPPVNTTVDIDAWLKHNVKQSHWHVYAHLTALIKINNVIERLELRDIEPNYIHELSTILDDLYTLIINHQLQNPSSDDNDSSV